MNFHHYLSPVIDIAKAAGAAIIAVYATDFDVVKKDDASPLTQADLAAHQLIVAALSALTPSIPILSEESEAISFDIRKSWHTYWLIDPLDGTREFIKRNGEFTVNIALIHQHQPVLGVVYAPVPGLLYFADVGYGAYKQEHAADIKPIQSRMLNLAQPVIAGSRSHADAGMQRFMQNLSTQLNTTPELISMGSSLKICLVAEGRADVYPRIGPTSEWDTAAAHCILNEAGGNIFNINGAALNYNNKQSLLNPSFFASGAKHDWANYL